MYIWYILYTYCLYIHIVYIYIYICIHNHAHAHLHNRARARLSALALNAADASADALADADAVLRAERAADPSAFGVPGTRRDSAHVGATTRPTSAPRLGPRRRRDFGRSHRRHRRRCHLGRPACRRRSSRPPRRQRPSRPHHRVPVRPIQGVHSVCCCFVLGPPVHIGGIEA
jgi:hypothetical protein